MQDSRVSLLGLIRKRIQTTMIGAIASAEKTDLGEEAFEMLRCEILDRGNAQIRYLEKDLDCYEVSYRKIYFIPLKKES